MRRLTKKSCGARDRQERREVTATSEVVFVNARKVVPPLVKVPKHVDLDVVETVILQLLEDVRPLPWCEAWVVHRAAE